MHAGSQLDFQLYSQLAVLDPLRALQGVVFHVCNPVYGIAKSFDIELFYGLPL